ncbi:HK97-gp10 family putative phage morphogenesis protein [Aeromonas veronii]
MEISWTVEGLKELDAQLLALAEMSTKASNRALKQAARKAMKPVHEQVVVNAPVDSTPDGIHIADNVKLKTSGRNRKDAKSGNSRIASAVVEISGPAVYYAKFVEFGRKEFMQTSTMLFGKRTNEPFKRFIGDVEPNQFMRNALWDNRNTVVEIFKTQLAIEIEKAIQKINTGR